MLSDVESVRVMQRIVFWNIDFKRIGAYPKSWTMHRFGFGARPTNRNYDEYFIPLLKAMGVLDLMKLDPDMPDSEVTVEYLMDNVWIVGGPDDVERQIRELYDEVGGFGVLLAMGHEWQPKDKWVNSMTLLAKEILPRLSDLD